MKIILNCGMKNYFNYGLMLLFGSMILANCDCKHVCTNPIPEINFVNFDNSDLQAVLVSEYSQTGNFDHLIASNVYTNAATPGRDTLQIVDTKISLNYFSDYILEVRSVGRSWHIRGMNSVSLKSKDRNCSAGLTYYLNDTLGEVPASYSVSNNQAVINITK
jgi:hypothetical protein